MARSLKIPRKLALFCGILSPLVTLIPIILALADSPWFSWTENWLSDIGGEPGDRPIWSARGSSSILFNLGLVFGGLLSMMFWTALKEEMKPLGPEGERALELFLMEGILLTLVGALPFSTGIPHMAVALVFFLLVPVFFLKIGRELDSREETRQEGKLWTFFFVLSATAIGGLALPRPWGGNAVVEMVPASCLSIFMIYYAQKFLRKHDPDKQRDKDQ